MSLVGAYRNLTNKGLIRCIDNILAVEGKEYTNDPADSGGETKWGITQRAVIGVEQDLRALGEPSLLVSYGWKGSCDMINLPKAFAEDVYTNEYYLAPKIDLIAQKSESIACELLDSAVNMGASRPIKWLQKLLNVLNNKESFYKDITEDGLLGKATVTALSAYLNKRGTKGEKTLVNALNALQCAFYVNLADTREKDEKYIYGWLTNRVNYL